MLRWEDLELEANLGYIKYLPSKSKTECKKKRKTQELLPLRVIELQGANVSVHINHMYLLDTRKTEEYYK